MEIRKIQQNGSSLVVVIPPKYLNSLHLFRGDSVYVELTVNQTIIIRKVVNNGDRSHTN